MEISERDRMNLNKTQKPENSRPRVKAERLQFHVRQKQEGGKSL